MMLQGLRVVWVLCKVLCRLREAEGLLLFPLDRSLESCYRLFHCKRNLWTYAVSRYHSDFVGFSISR